MIEQDLRVETKQGIDVALHPYYKKLSDELKAKRSNGIDSRLKNTLETQEKLRQQDAFKDKIAINDMRTESEEDQFRKEIKKSANNWSQALEKLSERESKNKEKMSDQAKEFIHNLKSDGKKIIDYFGHKINFFKRADDLKEMFKHNLLQSKSHNFFIAKFAEFKVGVVSQILSYIGIPIEELKKLRRDALNEAFEENLELMSQNLYNIELAELVHGRGKKTRSTLKIYQEIQMQLLKNMENLGRKGYWSKSKLFEERIRQLDKIEYELKDEIDHLTYQKNYLEQVEDV